MQPDMSALITRMAEATRAFVLKAETAIYARIEALEISLKNIPAGPKGEPGESIKGDRGDKGEPGESIKGDAGPKGEPGESIKGDRGDKGEPGESIKGAQGEPGKDAEPIHPDTVALMIRNAVDEAMKQHPPLQHGRDGRDAAELNILSAIAAEKHYPRGTWARYGGGIVRAARETDYIGQGPHMGLDAFGWETMIEGLGAIVVMQSADPREIEVAAQLTSGITTIAKFQIPMVLDKGVWRPGDYDQGDHVSWDGSGWIAQQATTDKPGTSEAWRLSTKRGRDGKDGGDPQANAARRPVSLK